MRSSFLFTYCSIIVTNVIIIIISSNVYAVHTIYFVYILLSLVLYNTTYNTVYYCCFYQQCRIIKLWMTQNLSAYQFLGQ